MCKLNGAKKDIFMIGNAHLDPVWMWRWTEGAAEVKATIRSALDRMTEFPDFKFVCSSALYFRWLEDMAPEMLDEIRTRVKEGRFVIVGGWWTQSDCNLPSGEGFARQGLYAQRYFYEHFGATAKVGYNVDSFGHSVGLPQILKKSGMDYYIFMRPSDKEMKLDQNVFNWYSPDGSHVLAYRIHQPYCYNFSNESMLTAHIKTVSDYAPKEFEEAMFFYGVGNHGGGPTIKNIQNTIAFNAKDKGVKLHFSEPLEFFKRIESKNYKLSELHDDLQHHASGCYSAVSAVKTAIRRAETTLYAAEAYSMIANGMLNAAMPTEKLQYAWENVLFLHFHDSFGGCCIRSAHDDMLEFAGESNAIAQKLTNAATQRLSWKIDTSDSSKGLPVVVFNPHPHEVTAQIVINKQVRSIADANGKPVACQAVKSETKCCYGRTDTLFTVTVPAMGYATYFLNHPHSLVFRGLTLAYSFRASNKILHKSVRARGRRMENEFYIAKFNSNGSIESFFDKRAKRELLSGEGAVPVVIDETGHDTWSHGKNYFDKQIGTFKVDKISVTENGSLRSTIKIESVYNTSRLTQEFSLCKGSDRLEVRGKIDWREKRKMLKLAFPVNTTDPEAYYEVPFAYIKRPVNGEEEAGQMWIATKGKDGGLAMLNNNKYSFSVKDNVMNLTVVRSPQYGDHGNFADNAIEFTDQGEHKFEYALMPVNDGFAEVVKAAHEFNVRPFAIMENNHKGVLPLSYKGLETDKLNVAVSAFKRSEDNTGTVIRAYETNGQATTASFSGGLIKPFSTDFSPFEMKTLYNADGSDSWEEILITELR